MRTKLIRYGLLLLAALGFAVPSQAHHSWAVDYRADTLVSISGIVSRVIFRSPHASILINAEDANGKIERWTIEWGSPHRLRERGVEHDTIRVGDEVLVSGHAHRNPERKSMHMQSLVRRTDGLRISGRGQIETNE